MQTCRRSAQNGLSYWTITGVNGTEIVAVDERDSSWERNKPRFRVHLQEASGSSVGGRTATYDIVGADVAQVIDWAQRQAGASLVYSVALVCDDEPDGSPSPKQGRGLVWLLGTDGSRSELDPVDSQIQARMLARRQEPIIVPPADRMPPDVAESR